MTYAKRIAKKYLFNGYQSSGDREGYKHYRRGMRFIKQGAKYCNKAFDSRFKYCDLEDEMDYYKKMDDANKKAADELKLAAEHGNDMAVMNYAFYLHDNTENYALTLEWINKAYHLGFAPAAYMLATIYENGELQMEADANKATFYFAEFKKRCQEDERQAAISFAIHTLYDENEKINQLSYYAYYNWLVS